MEKNNAHGIYFVNTVSDTEADMKKARLISSIIEKAERGDEEENKGRS